MARIEIMAEGSSGIETLNPSTSPLEVKPVTLVVDSKSPELTLAEKQHLDQIAERGREVRTAVPEVFQQVFNPDANPRTQPSTEAPTSRRNLAYEYIMNQNLIGGFDSNQITSSRRDGEFTFLIDRNGNMCRIRNILGAEVNWSVVGEGRAERFMVKTPLGEREILLPRSDEGKTAWMRDILVRIEKTNVPDGGTGLNKQLEEATAVISTLIESPDVAKNALGYGMLTEARARLSLHQVFLKFKSTEDMGDIRGAESSLTGEDLNFCIVNMPGAWEAFVQYDANTERFLVAQGVEEEAFRGEVQRNVGGVIPPLAEAEYKKIAAESAQIIGEKLFLISARAAARNKLVHKTLGYEIPESETNDESAVINSGNVAFLDNARKVNEAVLRLVQSKKYLYFKKKDWNIPEVGLVEIGDEEIISSKDYFSMIPDAIEGYFEKLIFDKYAIDHGIGMDRASEPQRLAARRYARDTAKRLAEEVVGELKEEDGEKKWDDTGQQKYKWTRTRDGLINIANIKWRPDPRSRALNDDLKSELGLPHDLTLNFSMLFEGPPMARWALLNLFLPDKTRDVLFGNDEAYVRNPNKGSMIKLFKTMVTDFDKKEKTFLRYVNFASERMYKLTGKANLTKEGAEAMANELSGITDENGIPMLKPQDREKTIDKALDSFKSLPEKALDTVVKIVKAPFEVGKFVYQFSTSAEKRKQSWEDFKLFFKKAKRSTLLKFILAFVLNLFNPKDLIQKSMK